MSTSLLFTQNETGIQTDLNDGVYCIMSTANGVESTPQNIIDSIVLTRRDGKKKLGSQYDERPVSLAGTLQGGSAVEMRQKLQELKRNVVGDGVLSVQFDGEDTPVLFNVTVQNIVITSTTYGLSSVPFSIQMTAMDPPFGMDADYTPLLSLGSTNTDIGRTDTMGGSAEPDFNIQVTIPTVGDLSGIELRNQTTNTGLLLTQTFVGNDTVVIDTGDSSCLINGSPANFDGQVPRFIAGDNDWLLNFLTTTVTIDQQQKFYTTEKFIYSTTQLAQSFTPSAAINAQRIDVMLERVGNPSSVTLTIYSNSSGHPGTALAGATATVAGSSIPTGPAFISFNLQNVIGLANATVYWIVVSVTGAVNDVNNGVYWKVSGLNPYAGGNFSRSTDNGSTWTADSVSDAVFRVWKTTILASNVDTSPEVYTEDFTSTANEDTGTSTANWDTTNHRLTLGNL